MEPREGDLIVFRQLAPGVLQFFVRVDGVALEIPVTQRRALQLAADILKGCDL